MLKRTGGALLFSSLGILPSLAARKSSATSGPGAIIGEPLGAEVGARVLAEGGNAIDAAVAAALMSCVATPARCGIAGYGGHLTIALAGGKKIRSIDFNTTAPAAATESMFPLDENGEVKGRINVFGWLAAGVPGTLAGLQLALHRFGTRSLRELLQPAISTAKQGFIVDPLFASTVRGAAARFRKDPGSARLYLRDGEPVKPGDRVPNPELAELLATLAERNSVESFYRGDIAQRISDEFQKQGGLVTPKDLAAYHASEVQPLHLRCQDHEIFTAPLTAGGLTILEALSILKALRWGSMPGPAATHAQLETLRLAWRDRLDLLGDPASVKVPVKKLLSSEYAEHLALQIKSAVNDHRPLNLTVRKHRDDGTNNICSVDNHGNMMAITLTQGGSFGAQVTIAELGLTLGHGMSRFDPQPGSPNAPAPGKKPLHNMCPSVLLHSGQPILAIGGAGGMRIPNAVFDTLRQFIFRSKSLEDAVASPRLHSTGTLNVSIENAWPETDADYLSQIGFTLKKVESSARVSAVAFDPKTHECRAAMR